VNDLLTKALAAANVVADAVGRTVLAFIPHVPGWLSNTIVAAVAGVGMLLIFKHTSPQKAIGRVRDGIKADLLTLRLFKDSLSVTFAAQGRMIGRAGLLFICAIPPLLVMLVPIMLLLSQLGVYYQFAPLAVGEETTVAVSFVPAPVGAGPVAIALEPNDAVAVAAGPMIAQGSGTAWWKLRALTEGNHVLSFTVGDRVVTKSLSVGRHPMRLSKRRPDMAFTDVLLYPDERPFAPEDAVRMIDVDYRRADSWTSGADAWLVFFFVASIVVALLLKGALGVRV